MNGADILLESLHKEGVDVVFGYPGGVLLGLYDSIYDHKISHVLTRHEQGAVHAAEGYAKATGKVGVCIATSGPGATNLVTGIADAYMDSIPIVAITGQVSKELIGKDAFQEVDITGITRPIVKHSYLVKDAQDIPRIIKEAFFLASTGRPGPVLVDLPKDVLSSKFKGKIDQLQTMELQGYQPKYEGNHKQIKKILSSLRESKKPLIIMGGGIRSCNAHKELAEFSKLTGTPVISTFMGLGGISHSNPLYIGWLGMHGNYASNMAVQSADFILAIGTRFSDRSTGNTLKFAPSAKIAHIDIDPSSISKNISVEYPIVGDAKTILNQLLEEKEVINADKNNENKAEWLIQLKKWNEEKPFLYKNSDTIIKPQFVIEEINRITKSEAIIVTDVGQHQMWTGQYYKFNDHRQFISSSGLGTMGFGFPAAIGAKIGRPDKTVFNITGDGSILMNIQELITAVQYKTDVKIAILNNKYLGMVRQWQELFFKKRYSNTHLNFQPDFVKLAESFGCVGLRASKPSEVGKVLERSLEIEGVPVLMDFVCDCFENVFPMIPAGGSPDNMIFE